MNKKQSVDTKKSPGPYEINPLTKKTIKQDVSAKAINKWASFKGNAFQKTAQHMI